MPSWKQVEKATQKILDEVGNPPLRMVEPWRFEVITGSKLGSYAGRCSYNHNVMTVKRNRHISSIKRTIWHEVGHLLFRSKPHWWIELYAAKMSRTPKKELGCWGYYQGDKMITGRAYGRYALKYHKDINKDIESRAKLLEMSQKASAKLRG